MIKIVRKVLGDKITNQLGLIKFRYFPSKHETDGIQKRKAFYGSFIRKGDLVYDVWANRGNRIEPLLQLGAKVVAVEPQKSCYDFLKQRYGKKIALITKGLGSEEGVKKFYISNA